MIEDYSHTLQEQEEQHFYYCVSAVLRAFESHGTYNILKEICKNPHIKQELTKVLDL
jgi:hypothetical protein